MRFLEACLSDFSELSERVERLHGAEGPAAGGAGDGSAPHPSPSSNSIAWEVKARKKFGECPRSNACMLFSRNVHWYREFGECLQQTCFLEECALVLGVW